MTDTGLTTPGDREPCYDWTAVLEVPRTLKAAFCECGHIDLAHTLSGECEVCAL
jgi:hypothetical protein